MVGAEDFSSNWITTHNFKGLRTPKASLQGLKVLPPIISYADGHLWGMVALILAQNDGAIRIPKASKVTRLKSAQFLGRKGLPPLLQHSH